MGGVKDIFKKFAPGNLNVDLQINGNRWVLPPLLTPDKMHFDNKTVPTGLKLVY
jgi:hypothetical protein